MKTAIASEEPEPVFIPARLQLRLINDVLPDIDAGRYATDNRDYGRGLAYAAHLIRDAMKGNTR